MDYVRNSLIRSGEYGLQVETVTWALKAMKEDPNLSIAEAMCCGLGEWDV